ncbi:MAG: amidase family protein [Myxococcota bacterium]
MKHVLDLEARAIAECSLASIDYAENVRQQHAARLQKLDGILNLVHQSYGSNAPRNEGHLYNAPFVVSTLDNQHHAVEAMLNSGAVLMGETKHGRDPLGLDTEHNNHTSEKSARTPNPWDFTRVAGGMSGATAAAVASGGAAFSVAADHCGDLIISANFCGTVALRPSQKASTHGWHCRSVADAKEIFKAGSGQSNFHTAERPVVWLPTVYEPYSISTNVLSTIELCAEALLESKFSLRGITPPIYKQAFSMWASMWNKPENYIPKNPSGSLAVMMHQRLNEAEPEFGEAMRSSAQELKEALIELLFPNDVLLCPAFPTLAPKRRSTQTPPMSFIFSALFASLDFPALHVPVGFSRHGHPIGVQLIAAPHCESALFRVGQELEQSFRGWTRAQPFKIPGL